ncbi:MAG: collagen-like triple helix repeat-containing protein, partial [Paraclostridium sp.]
KFNHLWGEDNLSECKLRWVLVDDIGSLLIGEVPITPENKAIVELPNELFTGERRMKVQLTVASCDGKRVLNLQQFTDLKVINNLATNEVVEPVYNILINKLHDDADKYISEMNDLAHDLVKYISEQGFRIRINQVNHGFTFNPIQFETSANKYAKATKDNPADAMAIRVDNDNFDLVTSGSYPLSSGIKDVFGKDLVEDEYYFLDENVAGGFTPIKPIHIYQPLFLVAKDKGKLRALIEVETPTDLEPRIMNDFFDEQVERVVNTADERIEEIKTTQGMKGDKGDKGDTGAVGPQGIQGIQGLKGDTGIQGPIGLQGDKGDKGDAGSLVNIANNEEISLWLGTTADYEAIVEKSKGVLYQHFDEDGKFAGGYYKRLLTPVTREFVDWFEFADGKGTETTLKSRVSDNVLTLRGFNFDANSGWTGKGLKFDGVNDYILTMVSNTKHIEITFSFYDLKTNGWNRVIGLNDVNSTRYEPLNSKMRARWPGVSIDADVELNKTVIHQYALSEGLSGNVGIGRSHASSKDWAKIIVHSIKFYNENLTEVEIAQNYEYEQSIDRETVSTYPLLQEQKSYGIGLTNQLSDEQKSTFRLSVDGTKFVAGLRYCEGLEVEEFTYSEIQVEMEKEEWRSREEAM